MANKSNDDLFDLLRARGVRRKLAKPLAALDGNSRRAGAQGEQLARQAAEDLSAASKEIRTRVLRTDRTRSKAARKAAQTRNRKATKRTASAKKGAQTRAKISRTRAKAKAGSRRV